MFRLERLFFNMLKKAECNNFFTGRLIHSKPTFVSRNPSLFNPKSCTTPPDSVYRPVADSSSKCNTSTAESKTMTRDKLSAHKHNRSQMKYEKPVHDVSSKSVFSENQKSKKLANPVISKSNNETSLKKSSNQIPNPKNYNKLIDPILERKLIKSSEVFQNTHKASSTVNSTKSSNKSSKPVDPCKSKNINSNEGKIRKKSKDENSKSRNINSNEGKVREKSRDENTDEKTKSVTKGKMNEKKHIEQHDKPPKSTAQVKNIKNLELKHDTNENNTKTIHKTQCEKSVENINPSTGSKSTENQKTNNEIENGAINENYIDYLQQFIAISVEKLKLFVMNMFKKN